METLGHKLYSIPKNFFKHLSEDDNININEVEWSYEWLEDLVNQQGPQPLGLTWHTSYKVLRQLALNLLQKRQRSKVKNRKWAETNLLTQWRKQAVSVFVYGGVQTHIAKRELSGNLVILSRLCSRQS